MTKTAADLRSAAFGETTELPKNLKAPPPGELFQEGNVVFRTSDHVIFRVEDFYLKANR
jgi:hypothetical protein